MNDRLWAPWRAELFSDKAPEGCIFCTLPASPAADDEKNLIVHRGEKAFVILNKYPYTAGHVMVVPFAHIDDLAALAPLSAEMFGLAAKSTAALKKIMRPDGFNLGMNVGKAAGAGVPGHAHLHVVPRWSGDHNFMSVLADRRVISEGLNECWARVREAF